MLMPKPFVTTLHHFLKKTSVTVRGIREATEAIARGGKGAGERRREGE